jgi:hypothetical protein
VIWPEIQRCCPEIASHNRLQLLFTVEIEMAMTPMKGNIMKIFNKIGIARSFQKSNPDSGEFIDCCATVHANPSRVCLKLIPEGNGRSIRLELSNAELLDLLTQIDNKVIEDDVARASKAISPVLSPELVALSA